jgi:hypothetical protein
MKKLITVAVAILALFAVTSCVDPCDNTDTGSTGIPIARIRGTTENGSLNLKLVDVATDERIIKESPALQEGMIGGIMVYVMLGDVEFASKKLPLTVVGDNEVVVTGLDPSETYTICGDWNLMKPDFSQTGHYRDYYELSGADSAVIEITMYYFPDEYAVQDGSSVGTGEGYEFEVKVNGQRRYDSEGYRSYFTRPGDHMYSIEHGPWYIEDILLHAQEVYFEPKNYALFDIGNVFDENGVYTGPLPEGYVPFYHDPEFLPDPVDMDGEY